MQGYDPTKAAQEITKAMNPANYQSLPASFDSLLKQAIQLDLAYMRHSGALSDDGMAGNAYYDDDEAFEFMLDGMVRQRGWNDQQEMQVAAFLDDYMDAQQAYMEAVGLLDWE